MSESKPVDLEASRLWLSHNGQDKMTVELGKRLIAEVESLRARVKELEAKGTGLGELAVTSFTCENHGLISPFPACPECETKGDQP
jgi:hypothetical protein